MTVSTSTTRRININTMVLRAGQLAGVFDPQQPMSGRYWEQLSSMARDFLQVEVDALVAQGKFARFVQWQYLSLVSGVAQYDMPAEVISLSGNAAYIPASVTANFGDEETVVKSIPMETFQNLSGKETSSDRPTLYYPHRESDVLSVHLWPVPSEAGRLRFQSVRNLADCADGAATVDVSVEWYSYLLKQLSYMLSQSSTLPIETRVDLKASAAESKRQAAAIAPQSQPNCFRVTHRTGWT